MASHIPNDQERGQTQERLLEAALDIFGRHGYDGATTRMIAGEAAANIATIPYYFGGKEGLYLAVIDRIVELIGSRVSSIAQEVDRSLQTRSITTDLAQTYLEQILTSLLTFMVGSDQGPRVARIILREQLDPSSAYQRIFEGFMGPALSACASLIRTIAPDETERSARIRALAIFGQILVFRVARETVVRGVGMQGYTPEETEEIRRIVHNHLHAILASLNSPPAK